MQTFLYIVLGVAIGWVSAVIILGKSSERIGKIAIYKNDKIEVGNTSYLIIGEHPFYNMQRVNDLYIIKTDQNGHKFATYKVHEYEPKIKC